MLENTFKTGLVKELRLAFDPPQSSTAMEALKNTVAEMEFRLNIEFDKAES